MLKMDEFESVFRSAAKDVFRYRPPNVKRGLVISDLEQEPAQALLATTKRFVDELGEDVVWQQLGPEQFDDVESLTEQIEIAKPDLVVTYRNMHSDAWRYSHSLGVYLNVLMREYEFPVLIVPSPHRDPAMNWKRYGSDNVMSVTNHLTGDDDLVNWGVLLTSRRGRLFLAHVEDDAVFNRYITAISKIGSIDTDEARNEIMAKLLREPADYIKSCRSVLSETDGVHVRVEQVIKTGHSVDDYEKLVTDNEIDLLIFRTMDSNQLALHGVSHSIALKMRDTPLLMI